MIKYYAYYNHGGYKDFYLGSIQDEDKARYFLPLLAIHEQELIENPNEELGKDVERQKLLPKLVVLSDSTTIFNYPSVARILMSHSGYKVLYRQLYRSTFALAIRDIPGSLDNYGRKTPFNIMFIGESVEDCKNLDVIAEYIRCNLFNFESFLNTIFENDLVENGLKVYLGCLNSKIQQIVSNNEPLILDESLNKPVRMMIIPTGMNLTNCLKEQNIQMHNIDTCYNTEGTIIYKAIKPQQELSNVPHQPIRSKEPSTQSPQGFNEQSNPSLHAMLNVPKREDIQKIWDYIEILEKRIENLENKK